MEGEAVALVTGCSEGGIGHGLALELATRGFHVVATSRSTSTMASLPSQHPCLELLPLDVSSPDSISHAVSLVIDKHKRIDILINNAGVPCIAPTAELPLSLLESTLKTNVLGPVALIQAVVPHMVQAKQGKIVNVGSIGGFAAGPWSGGYSASKFALHALTDSLRVELKPFGVQVILVAPGSVTSNIGERSASIFKGLNLKIYKPYEAALSARTRYFQNTHSTPTAEFAKKTIDAVLRKNPPRCFIYGDHSTLYALLYHMPLWIRDWYFARKFGLQQTIAEYTAKKDI